MTATATITDDWQVLLSTDDTGPGLWTRVSYAATDVPIARTQQAHDRWAPLNTPLVYVWQPDAGAPQETDPVTVQADRPILSSTLYAGSLQVAVVSQAPLRSEAASVPHEVLGRPDRVVSVAPMRYPSGTLRLYAADARRRRNLRSLLRAGDPLILRGTCPDAVDDMTIIVTEVTEVLLSPDAPAGPRWIDLRFEAASDLPLDWEAPPAWTWADVEANYATWADVEEAFPSWADLESGP